MRVRPAYLSCGAKHPGRFLFPHGMVDFVLGDDFLERIFFQIDVIQRKKHIAQGADDRRVFLFGSEKSRKIHVALPQLLLCFQLLDFRAVDGSSGKMT